MDSYASMTRRGHRLRRCQRIPFERATASGSGPSIRTSRRHPRTNPLFSYLLLVSWLTLAGRSIECDSANQQQHLPRAKHLTNTTSHTQLPSSVSSVSLYPPEVDEQASRNVEVQPPLNANHRHHYRQQQQQQQQLDRPRKSPPQQTNGHQQQLPNIKASQSSDEQTLNLGLKLKLNGEQVDVDKLAASARARDKHRLVNKRLRAVKESKSGSSKITSEQKTDRLGSEFVSPDYDFGFDVSSNNEHSDNNEQNQPTNTNELTHESSETLGRNKRPRYDLAAHAADQQPDRDRHLSPGPNRRQPSSKQEASGSDHSLAVAGGTASTLSVPPPPSTSASLMAPTRWSLPEDDFNFSLDDSHATDDEETPANVGDDDGQWSRQLNWNTRSNAANGQAASRAQSSGTNNNTISSNGHQSERLRSTPNDSGEQQAVAGEQSQDSPSMISAASLPKSTTARRSSDRLMNANDNNNNNEGDVGGGSPSASSKFSTLLSSKANSPEAPSAKTSYDMTAASLSSATIGPKMQLSVQYAPSLPVKPSETSKTRLATSGRPSGASKSGSSVALRAPVHARTRSKIEAGKPGVGTQDGATNSELVQTKQTSSGAKSMRHGNGKQSSEVDYNKEANSPGDNSLEIFSQQFKYTATKARKTPPMVASSGRIKSHQTPVANQTKSELAKATQQAKEHDYDEHDYNEHLNGQLKLADERPRGGGGQMARGAKNEMRLAADDQSGRRAPRTIVANKTVASEGIKGGHSQVGDYEASTNVRHAVYDLSEGPAVTTTSEHMSNYTAASSNYTNSIDQKGTLATTDEGNKTKSIGGSTLQPKSATKRRDIWNKFPQPNVPSSLSLNQKSNGSANPVLTLHWPPESTSTLFNRIQPKQDLARMTSNHYFQAQGSSNASYPNSRLGLPLANYIHLNQQQQPTRALRSAESPGDRASIVRSGFVVPTAPMHNLQALAPAAMALMAHAASTRPTSSNFDTGHQQIEAMNQLRALLTNHHHQFNHPATSSVDNFLAATSSPEYQSAASLQTNTVAADANQSSFQQQQPASAPMVDQMMATANQLGVSHLGLDQQMMHSGPPPLHSSSSMGGFNSVSLQDYALDLPASSSSAQREHTRGGASDLQGPQLAGSLAGPGQESSSNEHMRSEIARGPSSMNSNEQEQQQPSQHQRSGGGGSSNNNNNYSPEFSQPVMSSNGPAQSVGSPDGQAGGYNAYYDTGRNSSSSSVGATGAGGGGGGGPASASDYYGPLTRSSPNYYMRAEHKSSQGDSMVPNSPRSSLDPFEDMAGSPLSTSEYERDLADLDEEFNRHAIFSRPSRPSSYSPVGSASLMSDSMLSYSPDRYESIRYHNHHHHHHHQKRPHALLHGYESNYGTGGGGGGSHSPAHTSPSGSSSASLLTSNDYLNAAGSISNIIPRPFHHHYHHSHRAEAAGGGGGSLWPAASNSAYSSAPSSDPDMWLTDSSYDFNPLASFLAPTSQLASAKWRPPPQVLPRYHHHQLHHYQQQPQASHSRSPLSPYLTLSPAGGYLSATASEQPGGSYSLVPSYASAASTVAATSAAAAAAPNSAPETVSFTISPLAAAAAAAATALAAADKTRHHHHGHSWTFTLPRLASTLASQASAQLAPTTSSGSHSPTMAASSPFQYATTSQYRTPLAGSYLFGPMPIYAIATRPANAATQLTSAASAATPSIVPIHAFHPAGATTGAAGVIAYRPTSIFASTPMLTSLAYPVRLPVAAPSAYYPHHHHLPTGLATSASHDHSHHHHQHSLHHYPGRPSSSGRGVSIGASGLKPFYADLQFAESKPKLNNGQNGGNGGGSSLSKGLVKATGSGLTQIARNLTKKMFGSASQMRPQFVAPPSNFEPFGSASVPATAPPPLPTSPSVGAQSATTSSLSTMASNASQRLTRAPQLHTSSS